MIRQSRPDVLDLQPQKSSTSTRARSRSFGSVVDKPLGSNGSSNYSFTNPFTNVSPEPAYIAASAATGIVTGNHEDFLQDERNAGHEIPTIPVTPASLQLINQFLDFLLHSFLSAAKSTSLKALRPAVSEVLRNRLAKEAVSGADQELNSYLGGGDDEDEDFDGLNEVHENSIEWDLDVAWRRTRLRCMVYSSLGDIEEDDEEIYSGYGNLEGIVGSQLYEQNSNIPGVVSPAVAIWLTAVLEFMGEQALLLAGHAAINRFTQRMAAAGPLNQTNAVERERPMVEELDTEKVALNSSLGRLWRQWRKRVRGRGSSFSTPSHNGALFQRLDRTASRMSSNSTLASTVAEHRSPQTEAPESLRVPEEGIVIIDKELELNDGQKLEETTLVIDEKSTAIMTPKLDVKSPYLSPEPVGGNQKRRPQSLVLLPWTTEAPFICRSSLRRPHSLPTVVRSEFPDPVEGVKETEDQGTGSEDIDLEFFTPTEEQHNLIMPLPVFQPESNKQELLEPLSPGQPEISVTEDIIEDVSPEAEERVLSMEAEVPSTSSAPETAEIIYVSQYPEDTIGSAHTSDVLVLPESRKSSLSSHKSYERDEQAKQYLEQESQLESVPCIEDQQIYQGTSRRPAELVEIRTNGRVSTFQEQRAANRRPSATTLTELDSDDDSSIAASQRDRLTPNSANQEYFAHTKQTSTSSKYSQHSQLSDRKLGQLTLIQPPGSTTSLPIDRGNVRAWTPPHTPNKTRRSSSFGKVQRPVTSHSGTSQSSNKLKSFISWPMETGKQTKVHESDDDSRSSLHSDQPSLKRANLDDKERSFEELISSGDTIHCTITPDPLRRMEVKEVPRTATSALADFLRNTGPDGKESGPPQSRSDSRPSTARAIPIIPKVPSAEDGVSLSHLLRSTSASPTEPRPQTPSPALPPHTPVQGSSAQQIYGSVQENISPKTNSHGQENSPKANSFGPMTMSPGSIPGIPSVLRNKRSDSHGSRPKNRLVARDASGFTTSDSTSALADFFRNTTPPIDVDGQVTQRRISRSVAPFRNTMDCDQFELPEGPDLEQNNEIPASELTFLSSVTLPPDSYQSSFSSSTALLQSNSKKQQDYGAVGSMPDTKPKQTRVRDPYDIDELEDDDEDLEALSLIIPRKREEESLIDFLRNVSPPPQPPTPPEESDVMKTVQKKNSSVSLIGRFGRSSRKNSIASNADKFSIPPVPQVPGGYKHTPLAQEDDYPSRPIFNSRMDMDSPSTPSSARFGGRLPPARGAVQARGARVDRDNIDGLADFLKFSEPPPATRVPITKEDTSAMAKFKNFTFSRKSKRNEVSGFV